ncbi:glycerol kinase [Constrictibacter sp. MBR-5]|jgi:glycerol kinase|uniref:glycerol kinase GlpK n=1 Tax=Constrictibacter sp. MBR-5 TaxID=3156467 RepID=UPI0033960407
MAGPLLLAIDQGTTSTRSIVFDADGHALATAQEELTQHYPHPGWVEHDPEEIWRTVERTARAAAEKAGADRIVAIGLTNQRETAVVWDRDTGEAVHPAIVWQDRRGADRCRELVAEGIEPLVQARSGLVLDSYFSATKVEWILRNVPGAAERAGRGDLAFGTVDSFLLWRLTGGRHVTDETNAARTLLYDIEVHGWDEDLLRIFGIPRAMLPEVLDSAADFGSTATALLGRPLPICGVAGDQQAATVGQACFTLGSIKSTYGTGCFLVLNTGDKLIRSSHRLLTTPAYRLGGRTTYALEGSIFNAGTTVKWLRDELRLIRDAAETEAMAASVADTGGVYVVPAFTGLGAPHWDADARGAILGLTRDAGAAAIARASLEAVAYQTRDLIDAMVADGVSHPALIRVDGGMAGNGWLLQFLADMLEARVERPMVTETTALGAACLAGLHAGVYGSLDDIASRWRRDRGFEPAMSAIRRDGHLAGWHAAVGRVRSR